MFTLVTGIVGRWRAVCVTALQRPNSDAAAIDIIVGIAAASLSVKVCIVQIMPAERKNPSNMEEKDSAGVSKDSSDKRAAGVRERAKDELKVGSKKDSSRVTEEKKKKTEDDKRKKEDKDGRKKEEDSGKAVEEEKRDQEEERKKREEELSHQEEAAALVKEKEEAHQLHQEAWERHQARKELRSKNQNASEHRPEEHFFSRLDSSLKKNTAFVKKLRTITEQQRDSLSHDFNGLNLSKYIAEAAASIVEAKLKISDVNCAVHLCSLFHQRYADFAQSLLQVWKKHFEARKEDKTPNITKLRTDLRFIAELTIIGIFTDKEGLSLIYEQLKNIINADRESHTHVSVVISFCRHCGDDIAGLVPRKVKCASDKFNLNFPPSEIISPEKQQPFQNLLKEYFTSLTKHLKRDHRELQNIERQNRKRTRTTSPERSPRHSDSGSSTSRSPSLGARSVQDSEHESEISLDPEAPEFRATVDSLIVAVNHALKVDDDSNSAPEHAVSFSRTKRSHNAFASHPAFLDIVRRHREHPDKRFTGKKVLVSKYPFSADLVKDWTDPPTVDPPVSRLASKTLLSVPEGASIKSPTERQIDSLARSVYEASGSSLSPSFAAAWVSKAMVSWADALAKSINEQDLPSEMADLAKQLAMASDYVISGAQSRALLCAIHSLRQSGVIVPVPEHERFRGFYSNLFVVPKKDGTVRPILDLKLLNRCVRVRHFRMESLRSVISSMERGEFLASIDIKDAYLHIPIFPPHQRFLRFAIREDHFQFTALPFGLATAPRVFTKVMAAVMAILHSRGVVVLPYLDDLLIKGPSFQACESSVHITLDSLSRLGWLINLDKSSPVPSRRISFLGMILDTSRGLVLLPRSKVQALQQGVRTLCHPRPRTIRFAMKILGKMVAAIEAVPFAQLHLRPLQQALLDNWDRSLFSLDLPCPLSPRVRHSLIWWTLGPSLLQGKSFLPFRWLVVTTDASLLGWGAVFLHHSAQGRWTARESSLPINILEIRAIRLALIHFHALLAGHPIRVQSDNVTAVAYINHQGGTRSRAAMREVSLILRWAETNHSIISAVHIPGVENWAADFLSRQGLASGEWELHPEVFLQICLRWGTPDVDLMASRWNAKVHNFIARSRDPQAIGVDALISPWHHFQLPYVFPPLPLLPKVIRKIRTEGGPVILVAPDWPRRAWYAELVQLVADVPLRLPDRPDLLRQRPIYHQSSGALRLTAWLLKPGF
ncbi:unnamed protein product [Ranitomeya imitator]|uniref:ribonuclease H n=1 Tax=Ranitomeya imitator TaxID=111125 RepID=A0ABN9KTM0_9NEOB|nr:unnamed protein product [Ranitomeya imitator]